MTNLRDRITNFTNRELLPLGEAALSAFNDLPGASSWAPENFWGVHLDWVFEHGLPLAFIATNRTADRHRSELAASLFRGAQYLPSKWSEVHAGALLSHWGFDVRFLEVSKVAGVRTPDIELLLGDGQLVDVEVVRAESRPEHRAAHNRLDELVSTLGPADIGCDLLLIFQDASNVSDVNALFEAAHTLKPDETAECDQRWFACALPIGELGEGNKSVDQLAPAWWKGRPCLRTNAVLLGGSSQITPTVQCYSQPPQAGYEAPILRKANRSQRREGHPYLICVDMTAILGWRERVEEFIAENFPVWNHVSGVFAFERRFWTGASSGKLYLSSMFVNRGADVQLPKEVVIFAGKDREDLLMLFSDTK